MRRRLDLAATLVARPAVLFLDEPTTGLDPRARNELWAVLDSLVGQGTTVLLTTQYLEEAERLADDIVVVDHGRVIARGDARQLKREIGGDQLHVVVADPADLDAVDRDRRARSPARGRRSTSPSARSTAPTDGGAAAIAALASALADAGDPGRGPRPAPADARRRLPHADRRPARIRRRRRSSPGPSPRRTR